MIYRDRRLMPLVFLFLLISCGGGGDGAVTPPIAPTGLNAVPGESIITLSWEDNSDNESSFVIYREEFADTELNQLALSKYQEVPADTTSYVDNVDPNKLYSYRVTAKNSQGETPDDASQNVVDKVQANPSAGNYRLRILRSGDGGGVTVSSPAGIDCDHGSGGDCSEVYKEGTVVSLTATPDSTSQVVWDGICEGSTNS